MSNNNKDHLALRPTLHLPPATTPEEQFQNEALRPVMKQQNTLLKSALQLFLKKRKVNLLQVPTNQRFAKVKELVTRDNRLRGLLFGIAVGQFTEEEMAYYMMNEREVNRRMTNLLVERLQSVDASS